MDELTAESTYCNSTFIKKICNKYTSLSEEDIDLICEQAKNLQQMADLAQANIFIDCPLKDQQHAIVVAEAAPTTAPSLYTQSVVGKIAYKSYEPAVVLTHQRGKPVFRKRAISQEGKLVKQSVVPIKNKHGRTIGSLIMEQDISEQATNEKRLKALSKTTTQLSQTLISLTGPNSLLTNMIQEALFLIDVEGRVVYVNSLGLHMAEEMADRGDIVGSDFHLLFPWLDVLMNHKDEVLFEEMKYKNKVFEVKCIKTRDHAKQLTGRLILIRDITELREKERQLIVKSAVIKEIHHRVKNSLQTVASLIRLQMKRGVPKDSLPYFQEMIDRILSIATVHEVLSDTTSDEAECLTLLETIGRTLVQNRNHEESHLSISINGDKVVLQSNRAISLALIVHELIQNSIKHAFPHQVRGEIGVHVKKEEHDVLTVTVQDNGIGYEEGQPESLGMEIVHMLVHYDLCGQYHIKKTTEGTTAVVQVPLKGDEG
ncbi:two-component sensor histidine kinase [Caldalkalibacillus uzonensis]|uniref:histidine kinase n=1 Tax=Caldalkalibacillus uzonensis TaxID=353224 RepID=A0ABU0CQQ2_9BACI|nr:PAS domain-containing sensor histidine kinase [Caldalkalibacillus uzonensis]MDQ0338737.1 two-component sensor histidine kinase [Caldalkalibacillus uzonensis]